MSSPTWSRTPTHLVLAFSIVTAVACIKTSYAQEHSQGYEKVTETLSQLMTRVQAIENQTKNFNENIMEEIRTLKDIFVCNKTGNQGLAGNGVPGKKATSQFAIDLVPRRRQDNSESILMMENSQKDSDISHWTKSLNEMIARYAGHRSDNHTLDTKHCSEENPANPEVEVCIFDYQYLGTHCNEAENWGYTRKSPCIILKMNNILNWVPDYYRNLGELPTDMPESLKTSIKQSTSDYGRGGRVPAMLWVNCAGQTSDDDEHIDNIEYTPWQGFPAYYFPYIGHDEWLPPLVAVRFISVTKNVLINIECRVYAKNINHSRYDSDDYNSVVGVMNFELFID